MSYLKFFSADEVLITVNDRSIFTRNQHCGLAIFNAMPIYHEQKARTKKIINKTASSNRENPQKTKQFCVQGCYKLEPFAIRSRSGNRAAQIQTTMRLIFLPIISIFATLSPFPTSKYIHIYIQVVLKINLKSNCKEEEDSE